MRDRKSARCHAFHQRLQAASFIICHAQPSLARQRRQHVQPACRHRRSHAVAAVAAVAARHTPTSPHAGQEFTITVAAPRQKARRPAAVVAATPAFFLHPFSIAHLPDMSSFPSLHFTACPNSHQSRSSPENTPACPGSFLRHCEEQRYFTLTAVFRINSELIGVAPRRRQQADAYTHTREQGEQETLAEQSGRAGVRRCRQHIVHAARAARYGAAYGCRAAVSIPPATRARNGTPVSPMLSCHSPAHDAAISPADARAPFFALHAASVIFALIRRCLSTLPFRLSFARFTPAHSSPPIRCHARRRRAALRVDALCAQLALQATHNRAAAARTATSTRFWHELLSTQRRDLTTPAGERHPLKRF